MLNGENKYTVSSHLSFLVRFHFAHLFQVPIITVIGWFVCLSFVSLLFCTKDVSHLFAHSSSFVSFRVAHFSYVLSFHFVFVPENPFCFPFHLIKIIKAISAFLLQTGYWTWAISRCTTQCKCNRAKEVWKSIIS